MTISNAVSQIVTGLTSGIATFGTAIAEAVKDMFTALLFETTGTGDSATTTLSSMVVWVVVAGAIALAVGMSRKIFGMADNLGAK